MPQRYLITNLLLSQPPCPRPTVVDYLFSSALTDFFALQDEDW